MSDSVKKYKAKQFRVAVAGKTIDGREITEQQINDMAATYSTTKYQARIWLEHLRGYSPNSEFKAYGDVVSVEAKRDANNILGLYATLEPLPTMVSIVNDLKQKIFSSIEINPNFQGTGRAYLEGLAFTDSPASTGTEVLQFSTQVQAKKHPEKLYSAVCEVDGVSFEEVGAIGSVLDAFTASMSALASKFSSSAGGGAAGGANGQDPRVDAMLPVLQQAADAFKTQQTTLAELKTQVADLADKYAQIDKQDASQQHRQQATGGTGAKVNEGY
jgi:hypothetical protein